MEISTLCPASSGHVELLEFSWPPDPGVDGQRSCVAYVLMIREGGFLLAVPDPFFSDEDLGIAGSVSEALDLGPYLRLQASPVALSPDGEWVPANSPTPVPALLLDLPETSTMLLSPLEREFFEGEHFVAGDPALFPLASDVLVQARAWIVSDATGDLASGYHAAEEPGAVPPVNPKRAPKAKRPTVAQLAQQQATLTTIVARLSEQLEQLQQQGAAHAGGFPPTGGAQVARGPMTGAVAPQVAAGQAQGLGAVAAQVATAQAQGSGAVASQVAAGQVQGSGAVAPQVATGQVRGPGAAAAPSFLGQAQVPEAGALHVSAGQVQSAGAGSGQNALGQVSGRGFLLQDARAAIREAPLSSHLPPFQSVPKSLASVLGPPPPARALLPRPEPETDKDALLASAISNGELPNVRPPEDLASAVLAQSRALPPWQDISP